MNKKQVIPVALLVAGLSLTLSCTNVNAEETNDLESTNRDIESELLDNKKEVYQEPQKLDSFELESLQNNSLQSSQIQKDNEITTIEEKNGWIEENGYWYYYENNVFIADEYRELKDTNDEIGYYYFDKNGHMVTNKWVYPNEDTIWYVGNNGKAYQGKHTINDKEYLFNENYPHLLTNYSGVKNKIFYKTDENGIIIYEKKIEGQGWIQIDDKWAYVNEDGSFKQNEWFQDPQNKYWYYFDGFLTVIGEYNFYNNDTDSNEYYYFDENGRMLTNRWVYPNDDTIWYVGNNGKVYHGKHTIDGVNYLFENRKNYYPRLLMNYTGIQDSSFYQTDENGVIIYEKNIEGNGWVQIDDRWAYANEDGSFKQYEWFQDPQNKYWYYFDWDYLTVIGEFYYYNDNTDSSEHYYFDENGRMLTNQWVYPDEYTVWYVGNNGKAYQGAQIINGKKYLFSNDYPQLLTNYEGIQGRVFYQTDENGVIIYEKKIEGQGWIQIDDRWAYVNEDGSFKQNEWFQDPQNKYWYYFDTDFLSVIGEYIYYNDNTDSSEYYYFDENGRMLTNQWVYPDEYTIWYVGNNGKVYHGKHTIDGINYLFENRTDYYPQLLTNYKGMQNSTFYQTDENGIIIYEKRIEGHGWIQIDDRWAYVNEAGSLKQNEWFQDPQNKYWYYFDWESLTVIGEFYYYNDNTDSSEHYYFDENGRMLTNQWVYPDEYTVWYVGNNGKAYHGAQTINGNKYLFSNDYPELLTNYKGIQGRIFYQTDENGVIVNEKKIEGRGWVEIDDRWAYVNEDGSLKQSEWFQDPRNKYWYYFDTDYLSVIGEYNYYNDNTVSNEYYYFDENGRMLTNYWLLDYNYYMTKSWSYFGTNGLRVDGFQTINNKKYIFKYGHTLCNGKTVIDGVFYKTNIDGLVIFEKTLKPNQWENIDNEWFYMDENNNPYNGLHSISEVQYYFDDGVMQKGLVYIGDEIYSFGTNGHMVKNNWWQDLYSIEKNWYYFDNNGIAYNGWLNNTYYLIDGVALNGVQYIDGKYYTFDHNGKLIANYKFKEGWNLCDGYYYYLDKHNEFLTGIKKIDNEIYYFDENGMMNTNIRYWDDDFVYFFGSNGKRIMNQWYKVGMTYIYADNEGVLVDNWQKINDKWYYFSNNEMVNTNTLIKGEYHQFASNGEWLGTKKLDGWIRLNDWMYYSNGKFLTGWQKINNKWYYFTDNGFAIQNTIYIIDNETYYFMDNCEMAATSGWIKTSTNDYVYLNDNHRVVSGWQKINNIWYYLNHIMYKGIHYIEGQYHEFNNNGAWMGTINPSNGWYKSIDNHYYYFENGSIIKNQWIMSGSNSYYLNDQGKMVTGLFSFYDYSYYFDNNGKLLKNQWIKINNKWIYVDDLGRSRRNVTLEIDNVKYKFDQDGFMI